MGKARVLALAVAVPIVANCHSQARTAGRGTSGQATVAIHGDTVPDTAGCDIVTQSIHPNPTALVTEFLRRDTTGEFTSSNAWHATARACPGREPGWDTYTIVTGYHLVPLGSSTDTSRYEVAYDVYAEAADDSFSAMNRSGRSEIDTFLVVHTPFGWRIESPVIPPHISPGATLRIMQITNSDRIALTRLMTAR